MDLASAGRSIREVKMCPPINRYGMTADGYTKRSGAPTDYMIRLDSEKRWRRVFCIQFSNAGSICVRVRGELLSLNEYDLEVK